MTKKYDLKYKLKVLIIGTILYCVTISLPVFTSLPNYIFANITGTAMVSIGLGPIYGAIFVAVTSLIWNFFSKSSVIIITSVFIKLLEAIIIGLMLNNKKSIGKLLTTIATLSLVIKPISFALTFMTNKEYFVGITFFNYFKDSFIQFLNSGMLTTILTYSISCIVPYIIILLLDKKTNKDN